MNVMRYKLVDAEALQVRKPICIVTTKIMTGT